MSTHLHPSPARPARPLRMHSRLRLHERASPRRPHPPTVHGVATHLAEAAVALRGVDETGDRERAEIWWTARQATDTALGVLAALDAAPGPRRLEFLRESVRAARGAVESGKAAIYESIGKRPG
ncbi:hypothetical protein [Kitasatospora brasiliensis]|uniref:hypothetical protein n=1 Tax=Kitasatospora brasiliensis TaxID=3058040 RepID=UPI002931C29A|nr:hypothetical protein [Kitasatospora sp. K002]